MKRVRGYPTSSNRASSLHLRWAPAVELREVAVDLMVAVPPAVDDLYFWALQAGFAGGGAAHLGLQWHPAHPGGTAVNWGGYDAAGEILSGSESELASATGNPHTRDFPWSAGETYRLRIAGAGNGWWQGAVTRLATGVTTVVRRLHGAGEHLTDPMVWSEVFARCDAPSVAVVWSAASGMTTGDAVWVPDHFVTSYQREEDGGCSNTDSRLLPGGVGQFTAVSRTVPSGTRLPAARP
jgi:hypothetical protein